MPYEDEDPAFNEPDPELNQLSEATIGACFAVFKALGPGLDESLYEAALCKELRFRNIPFLSQVAFEVHYRGEKIGERRIDLLIADRLVVELKAVEAITALHKAQLLTYLKITGRRLGLLVNFNSALLKDGIKRIINPSGK